MNTLHHTVALCGATGFIGSHLRDHFNAAGYRIVPLDRTLFTDAAADRLAAALDGCDTVVNVAGAPIDRRWSKAYKRKLSESRIGTTRRLVAAMEHVDSIRCWICASAVGYYPSEGCFDDTADAAPGSDFLARLCRDWEAEARKAPARIRTAVTRFGVVLDGYGGAFERLSLPAKLGMAIVPGDGRQPFTWIDVEDLCRAMTLLIETPRMTGTFNFVAPQHLSMEEAVSLVRRHYKAWFQLHVAARLLRLWRGEAADPLLKGQCVRPLRLLDAGFEFRTPELQLFLERLR